MRGFRLAFGRSWVLGVLLLALPLEVRAAPAKRQIRLRGEELSTWVYRAGARGRRRPPRYAILASGDGGWHGFENAIAKSLAVMGYEVHGIDSRQYLHAFTDGDDGVSEEQAAEDFHQIGESITGAGRRVTLVGWSAGAALVVLAASRTRFHDEYDGVVAISLPAEGILGWRWHDFFEFLPFRRQAGPFFAVPPLLANVPPVPIVILQSAEDRFISAEDRDEIAAAAAVGPERNVVIDAGSHSFSRGRDGFFRELRAGLRWIRGTRRPGGG